MIGKCFVQIVTVLLYKSPFASTGELMKSPVFVLIVSQTVTSWDCREIRSLHNPKVKRQEVAAMEYGIAPCNLLVTVCLDEWNSQNISVSLTQQQKVYRRMNIVTGENWINTFLFLSYKHRFSFEGWGEVCVCFTPSYPSPSLQILQAESPLALV